MKPGTGPASTAGRSGGHGLSSAPGGERRFASGAAWPFVGREAEIKRLTSWFADPRVAGAAVLGAAGSGKSRLLAQWLMRVPTKHRVVLCGRDLAEVAHGCLAPLAASDPSALDQSSPTEGVRAALRDLARGGGTLVVEDAQWIDAASADLLHELVDAEEIRVAVTARTGEALPAGIVSLLARRTVRTLDLALLSPEAVNDLLREAFGGPVDPALAANVATLSEGNPLYVRELVNSRLGVDAVWAEGMWTIDGPLQVSPLLTDLISARLDEVSAAGRDALALIAEAEHLSSDHLLTLVDVATVDELEHAGLVRLETTDGGTVVVRSAHGLFDEVVLAATPTVGRRELRERLADGLAALGSPDDADRLRIARWRLRALTRPSPDELEQAVELAMQAHDFALAADCGRRLWQAQRTPEAAVRLADALFALHSPAELIELDELLASCQATMAPDDERLVGLVALRELAVGGGLDQRSPTRALLADWVADTEHHPDQDRMALALGMSLMTAGLPGRALEALERVDIAAQPIARLTTIVSLWATGRIVDLRALLGSVRGEYDEVWVDTMSTSCSFFQGDIVDAEAEARTLLAKSTSENLENTIAEGTARFVAGNVAQVQGRSVDAIEQFRLVTGPEHVWGSNVIALGMLAEAAAHAGQLDLARRSLTTIDSLLKSGRPADADAPLGGVGVEAMTRYAVAPGEAMTRLAEGHGATDASSILRETSARLSRLGQHQNAAWLVNEATGLRQVRRADVSLLTAAEPLVGGRWVPLWIAHANAVLDRDIEALRSVADRLAAIGDTKGAIHAVWSAWDISLDDGRSSAAAAARERLDELVSTTDWSAGFRPPPAALRHLTPRELQVARLAADGLASKEIGERLDLAARTVDNNLQRIYTKLGHSGRQALRELTWP